MPKIINAAASSLDLDAPKVFADVVDMDALSAPVAALQGKVAKKPLAAAIVLAGGSGERFGHEGGKQLVQIAGRPVLSWSLEAFDACPEIGLIVLVCPEDRTEEYLKEAVEPYDFVTSIVTAAAGEIRQTSAFNGLEMVPDDFEFVAMHDGARPMISPEQVTHCINTVKGNPDCDGAVLAFPAVDTLKVVENGSIAGTPDRRVFWNAQTPQVFRTGLYRRAHAAALSDGFVGTDDSSLVERLGGNVVIVEGVRNNIKLTMPEDYLVLSLSLHASRM